MTAGWPDAPTLGEMIRRQRELAQLPMRQLAAMSGISNPYLSQIERGLREPSDQVLTAIADSLELSADALRPPPRPLADDEQPAVIVAIDEDPDLTPAQRKALTESYLAFRQLTSERRRNRGRGQRS